MSEKILYVIVPSMQPTGPVKGAVALCNGLVENLRIGLIPLKSIGKDRLGLDARIPLLSLAHIPNWKTKIEVIRKIFRGHGGRKNVVAVSMCFSADVVNFFMKNHARTISCVRGNLPRNYRIEYGLIGWVFAFLQFSLLRRMDRVVAISKTMSMQLRRWGLFRVTVIENFLDELTLERFRKQDGSARTKVNFLYLGRLSKIKSPHLMIEAMQSLKKQNIDCQLDIIGDGPLRNELEECRLRWHLTENIRFWGNVDIPYELLQKADVLILPSKSEGISRAVLESLFFGIPCIVSQVDSNCELIEDGVNGWLFKNIDDLEKAMKKAIAAVNSSKFNDKKILLPDQFRQKCAVSKYNDLIINLLQN